METNKKLKIIFPIIIIFIIIGIWFAKNNTKSNNEEDITIAKDDFLLETESLDLEQLKSYGLPIMIDFGADSCIPCKEMAPVLKELNAEYQDKVIIKFVDVWKNPSLADDFPVQVIPTQFFFTAVGEPFEPENPIDMQMILYTTKDTEEHVYTAHQGGMSKEQIEEVFAEMGVLND